ncbi:MAG TPA: hypothetical protein VGP41_02405 [Candidatus Lustribacter sp.]|jgi:hypothetical protein|nr:hypothetical protein [Candidatus Lustribacter sp.]
MKNTTSLAAVAAALLLATAPALASAAETGPIHIDSFQITNQSLSEHNVVPVGATIAFTNTNDSPATDVVLALQSDGAVVDQVEETGSFAKGIAIKHYFGTDVTDQATKVAVVKATFADGSVWVNPDLAVEPVVPADLSASN